MEITKAHVEAALDDIDQQGLPKKRRSRDHCLISRNRHYPTKYVLAVANGKATGHELRPTEHKGGEPADTVLEDLGYTVDKHCGCQQLG